MHTHAILAFYLYLIAAHQCNKQICIKLLSRLHCCFPPPLQVSIVDAYCPHLGANLGVGGHVRGNCIECPFHGWRFDGETGQCVSIPYTDKVHVHMIHAHLYANHILLAHVGESVRSYGAPFIALSSQPFGLCTLMFPIS